MVKKGKNIIRKLAIGYVYGLKYAEDLFRRQKPVEVDNTHIQQSVGVNDLADALLRGEVTQEVELLRDRTYYVLEESNKIVVESVDYETGKIKTRKKTINDTLVPNVYNPEDSNIVLVMENELIPTSAIEMYKSIDGEVDNEIELYPLKFTYKNTPPKYNLSRYFSKIVVKSKNDYLTCDLYVKKHTDSESKLNMVFNTEIKRILSGKLKQNNVEFETVDFVTNKAYGSDDLVKYSFNMIKFNKIVDYKNYYIIQYTIEQSNECIKLTDKYIKTELRERYHNKEKKDIKQTIDFSEFKF